ncbi:MAG: hypothetical protein LQ346_006792 [Caloplaca aetnensis]|nr:MAG: hypothetical protein LQ346_006792 [Caloplaca aetnensis]
MRPHQDDHEEQEKRQDELAGMDLHQGIAFPRDMSPPGEDGYRTPNANDYERERERERSEMAREEHSSSSEKITPPAAGRLNWTTLDKTLEKLHWRERVRHYTWTFFTMTMATGGIANVIYAVPFRFRGLTAIGVIFFLFNIVLFIINVVMISLRFYTFPETFRASYMHPSERLFIPAAVVSFGTILINISQYGIAKTGPWLNHAMFVLFWFDAALAVLASSGIYLLMWSTKSFTVESMTPIWIFPAYPLLIIGPHAAQLAKTLPQADALNVIVGGFTLQGIGFLVAFMIYASFIYRLMTQKLPAAASRPGMFVSVGPCGFTVAAVLGMADALARNVDPGFMGDGPLASMVARVVANWAGLWLWGLALWFLFVSAGAHWSCARQDGGFPFSMTFYSFVFPNTALVTATFAVGKAFRSRGIQVVGCVMTGCVIAAWFVVFGLMLRAVAQKQILWPQKGEDKDEGGFKAPEPLERRHTLRKLVSNASRRSRSAGND